MLNKFHIIRIRATVRQMFIRMLKHARSGILKGLSARQLLSVPPKKNARSVTVIDNVKRVYSFLMKRCMK